jgi:hypothetical protein
MSETAKPYELTFEERDGYLYARVKCATMTREIALDYLGVIAGECSRLKYKLMVIERDVPVMLPDSDLFFTTNDFTRMMRGIRVAFVNPHGELDDHMDFAMMIGTNRGARFTHHKTIESAERWLLSKVPAGVFED